MALLLEGAGLTGGGDGGCGLAYHITMGVNSQHRPLTCGNVKSGMPTSVSKPTSAFFSASSSGRFSSSSSSSDSSKPAQTAVVTTRPAKRPRSPQLHMVDVRRIRLGLRLRSNPPNPTGWVSAYGRTLLTPTRVSQEGGHRCEGRPRLLRWLRLIYSKPTPRTCGPGPLRRLLRREVSPASLPLLHHLITQKQVQIIRVAETWSWERRDRRVIGKYVGPGASSIRSPHNRTNLFDPDIPLCLPNPQPSPHLNPHLPQQRTTRPPGLPALPSGAEAWVANAWASRASTPSPAASTRPESGRRPRPRRRPPCLGSRPPHCELPRAPPVYTGRFGPTLRPTDLTTGTPSSSA